MTDASGLRFGSRTNTSSIRTGFIPTTRFSSSRSPGFQKQSHLSRDRHQRRQPAPARRSEGHDACPPQPLKGKLVVPPYPSTDPPSGPTMVFNLSPPRSFPEVKESDLYCSGFIRTEAVPRTSRSWHAIPTMSHWRARAITCMWTWAPSPVYDQVTHFQVVRPTKKVDQLKGGRRIWECTIWRLPRCRSSWDSRTTLSPE